MLSHPKFTIHASQAKGLEGLEEASRRRYLHVGPRRECGTVAALQIQNRLVDASLDRGRDAPFCVPRCPRSARSRPPLA